MMINFINRNAWVLCVIFLAIVHAVNVNERIWLEQRSQTLAISFYERLVNAQESLCYLREAE